MSNGEVSRAEFSDLVMELRELVIEMRHTNEANKELKEEFKEVKKDVEQLKINAVSWKEDHDFIKKVIWLVMSSFLGGSSIIGGVIYFAIKEIK